MNKSLMKKFTLLFLVLNFVSCANTSLPTAKQEIQVYISDGSRQCIPKEGQTYKETRKILESENIEVINSECGYLERIYPTVCGGKTGGIHIHSIYLKDLELAKKNGFMELEASIPHHKATCKIN